MIEQEHLETDVGHPRELADETLHSLIDFCEVLERLCDGVANVATSPVFFAEFSGLIDGISTFAEGISCVKRVLKLDAGAIPVLDTLENQLILILRDLLASQENRVIIEIADILKTRLKENLQNWREIALPVLIRARDC